MGVKKAALDGPVPSDTASVVLLPQTPNLDIQLASDVGFVAAKGARHRLSHAGNTALVSALHVCCDLQLPARFDALTPPYFPALRAVCCTHRQ
jgi:hypothetical protein